MRKVMVATLAYDGRVDVGYTYSLVQSIRLCAENGIALHPVWWPGEALVQHGRNMLVQLALDAKVDDVVFIDADQEWEPKDLLALLQHPVDVVGAAVRKKTDDEELYNVRAKQLPVCADTGLMIVDGLGTGFLRVTRKALEKVYSGSEPYSKGDQKCRMVFDVPIIGGQMWGEDTLFCVCLSECGFKVYLDAKLDVTHVGQKKYKGDFLKYVEKLQKASTGR